MKRPVPKLQGKAWTHRLMALLAAVVLVLAATACAGGGDATETATVGDESVESGQTEQAVQEETPEAAMTANAWQTDIRLGVESDYELYSAEGKDLATWDADVAKAREEGLKDAISADDIYDADADAIVFDQDGQIFCIGPSSLFGKVEGALDAYRLAFRLVETLGGSDQTSLTLLARVTKNDIAVYNFQQVANGREVRGATLKIAVDGNGEVTAVFANVDAEAKDDKGIISQKEAEAEAEKHAEGEKALPEFTQRALIAPTSFAEGLDLEVDAEPEPLDMAWVVYTANKDGEDAADRPYVAHQVRADGTYVKSVSVREPDDIEGLSGFSAADVFEGMEADTYTCDVERQDGKTVSVTVPVMHSAADDCYYLGDADRHVVVADFFEAAYGDHAVHPLKSAKNDDWDVEDVYTYYNYLRAWDFYATMGWVGPDGQNTDQVIFSGLCYRDHTPYENACYVGPLETWQGFGYAPYGATGEPLRLGWGLDVMAHEFTHCFTTTVMGQNVYKNDYGAINESMSDIMGNLCEYIYKDTDDEDWMIGENTSMLIRNMSDPKSMNQPAYVWDEHYGPHVSETTTINDNGGVHSNSSLLNLICAELCLKHSMSYAEAVDLWTTVSLGLTAGADYRQEPALLAWALVQTGLSEAYLYAVDELVESTRIYTYEKPEPLPADQQLVTLELPDTDAFKTKDWALCAFQVDSSGLSNLASSSIDLFTNALNEPDGLTKLGESVGKLLDSLYFETTEIDSPALSMDEGAAEDEDPLMKIAQQFLTWASDQVNVSAYTSWEEMDTHVIPLIVDARKPTVYMLIKISHGGSQVDDVAVKLGDRWYDLGGFVITDNPEDAAQTADEIEADKADLEAMSASIAEELVSDLALFFGSGDDPALSETTSKIEQLPTAGLEKIQIAADQESLEPAA